VNSGDLVELSGLALGGAKHLTKRPTQILLGNSGVAPGNLR